MEAFSLLRYWRSNGGCDATNNANVRTSTASTTTATTIVTAVSTQTSETGDEDEDSDENDHGPFFDLEFSLPAEGEENGETGNNVVYGEGEDDSDGSDELEDESELKFTLLSGSSGDSTADVNVSVSPSDDLFFKGSFIPVDQTTSEVNSKPPQSQSQTRVSLMKSATKFRVMMLKFKKSKSNVTESSESTDSNAFGSSNSKEEQKKADGKGENEDSGKSMTVKFKIEEVPIVSLFKRHNSSKAPKRRQNDDESVSTSTDEKKFSKEAMQRYLRKVKPLYVRVSKRYGEKLKFTGQLSLPSAIKQNLSPSPSPAKEEQKQSPAAKPMRENKEKEKESNPEVTEPPLLQSNAKGLKQGNLPAGLRVVCKHFGKSRSASTAVVAAAPPGTLSSKRRDDSLLQQQDGIQSAILHCKRSFKASRDSDCSSSLSNDSAPAYEKCVNNSSSDAADGKETTDEINKR